MRLAHYARLVADNANPFSLDKWQVIIHLHGSGNIMFLVDESELRRYQTGWFLRFDSIAWLVVQLENLGLCL